MPTVPFTLRIDPAVKQAVETQARLENQSAASVMQKAAEEYVSRQAKLREVVAGLETEADKGSFISDEAMTEWFNSLDSGHELPEPEADVFPRHARA